MYRIYEWCLIFSLVFEMHVCMYLYMYVCRYLQRVCKYLPPANSSERLALRGRFKNIEDMMISADDS
jgi:hypothetical protein